MKERLIAAIAIGALASGPAWAQTESGFYAGGSIGMSTIEFDAGGTTVDLDGTGYKIFGGYRINPNFAAEIAYVDFGEPDDTTSGVNLEADATGFNFAGVGILPLGRAELFGKIGLLAWDAEISANGTKIDDDDGTDLSFGIGGGYLITDNLFIRGEYELFDIDDTDEVSLLSVGVDFRF